MQRSEMEKEFLPLDVMINILKRVPVKSLIRFKCVSKEWLKILERSPFFTKQQLEHSAANNALLLLQRIHRQPRPEPFSTCIIGPHHDLIHESHLSHIVSPTAKILASCNGLLCLRHNTALSILNPATRQIRQVPIANLLAFNYVGFGFSPLADDYKIVRISMCVFAPDDQVVVLDNVRVDRVEVYSLASGSWREIDAAKLQPLCIVSSSVAITGTIFWLATMTSASNTDSEFVVSFDVGRDLFTLVNGPPIPHSPSHPYNNNVLAVCNDKLAMFRHYIVGAFESCSFDLWVLEDFHGHYDNNTCDVSAESWVKMYSVGPFSRIVYPLSLWGDEIVCREELSGQENDLRTVETVLALFNPLNHGLVQQFMQASIRLFPCITKTNNLMSMFCCY
ncbi:putative F-box protein At1g32420 isoform X2 [Vigna angularis]|uniref:putative F-box protein At1g32420 isoform X2 n=1 Tax=Phaseolus angularis TaxID=3914 RepID=UPI00080A766F|nr:putative F-box protein At1g32420 isoform X2 [Vigna angularis]